MTTTLTSTVALDEEGERLDTYLASLRTRNVSLV